MESAEIETIKLAALDKAVGETWEEGLIPFFFDETGNASVFFNYKGKLIECAKGAVQAAMDPETVPAIVDGWRKIFVAAMKIGTTCVLNLDKTAPDFVNKFNSEMFPVPTIFLKEEITKSEVYLKMVKEDENVDSFGNKGLFVQQDNFKLAVLSARGADSIEDFKDKIPLECCKLFKITA